MRNHANDIESLAGSGYRSSWGKAIETERAQWTAEVDRLYAEGDSSGLSQVRCLGELNERLLPPGAVAVSGSGSIPSDMQRVWRTRAQGSHHMEYGFSCMSYEIAGALGAKIAEPGREVVAEFIAHRDFLFAVGARVIGAAEQASSIQGKELPVFDSKPRFTDEEWKRLTEGLNRLGERALEKGMALTYHHHMGTGVQTAEEIDRLMESTKPAFWACCMTPGI